MNQRILFYCQHVLGMGHLIRSTEIVRALHDFDVCFLNGGEMVPGFSMPPGVHVVNLPPISADAEFETLRANGDLETVKKERAAQLIAEYERFQPDMVIVELFPFGRRKFTFELIPLLDHIRASGNGTKVACSLRDILVSKQNQARYEERVCRDMNQYFDLLLVHSDPHVQQLDETFSRVDDIACELCYTGFVVQRPPEPTEERSHDDVLHIVGSIGGGRVGYELLACLIEASDRLPMPLDIQLFVGPYMPSDAYGRLQALAAQRPQIALDRYTTALQQRLIRADLSVSMAGYNTCMDLVATGVRALVLPYTGNGDEEQTIRARKLSRLGVVGTLDPDALSPAYLAERIIDHIAYTPRRSAPVIDTNGTRRTAAIIADVLAPVGVH